MITILTSSLGGSCKINGKRVPTFLLNENSLTDKIKGFWKEDSNVLIISASPEEFELNDSILYCQKEAFDKSGLKANSFDICDYRNEQIIEKVNRYDVILLTGGHVPTQNRFFKKIDLKEKLANFDGLIIAWSAGSMNCAETVYAQPELDGEGIDQEFQRFIPGLGLTKFMIIPHFQDVRTDILDGLRIIEDITYPDSIGKEFIALNDGGFIITGNGVEFLYGESFLIKNGEQSQICKKDECVRL
jgi:dipeptidase E